MTESGVRMDGAVDPDWLEDRPDPFVIAEIGVNHNGSLDLANQLVDASVRCGADAVKLQVFRTDSLVAQSAEAAPYQVRSTRTSSQAKMLREYELSMPEIREVRDHVRNCGVEFLATPFDLESLSLVESLDPMAHKLPSGDITHLQMLDRMADLGRPIIISTGMATLAEVADALAVVADRAPVALLHCITSYPAPLEQSNLRSIPFLAAQLGVAVGWSDHTTGEVASVTAVALGARILERHITLDRTLEGPDHASSLDPAQFVTFVESVRSAAAALGTASKSPMPCEEPNRQAARRSWHATRDLPAGHRLIDGDLAALRPEVGVPCNIALDGRTLHRGVASGSAITLADLLDTEDEAPLR